MRAEVDHLVDRPEMYAQQCVQLTGTNRPTGLIRSRNGTAQPRRRMHNASLDLDNTR